MSVPTTSKATATVQILNLPYIDVQHDAMSVFDDIEHGVVMREDIWVSGYKAGESSVHGKVRLEAKEGGGVEATARDGINVEQVSRTTFLVSVPALDITQKSIRFPRQVINPPYPRPKSTTPPLHINALAFSPRKQLLAVAGPDGYLCILPSGLEGGTAPVMCKGHVGDVLDVKFFPSGEVILSSSSDLSARIWGLDGSNPRTLKGHTRAITSTAMLGVGKEVLTASKDGTVRLWNISQGKEIRKWTTSEPRCAIEEIISLNERGVVLACRQDGVIQVFKLDSEVEGGRISRDDGIEGSLVCAAWNERRGILAVGYSSGMIHLRVLDVSQLDLGGGGGAIKQERMIRRNEAAIYSLAWTPQGDLLVGTASGLPCRLGVDLRPDGAEGAKVMEVKEEMAGWEAVGVEAWAVASDDSSEMGGGGVWCAGGEGGIRRY